MSGLVALCKMLETNSSLLSLKYAPALHISVATMLLAPTLMSHLLTHLRAWQLGWEQAHRRFGLFHVRRDQAG